MGGTNARVALCRDGRIDDFAVESTPAESEEFFRWMSDKMVQGAAKGAVWTVIGVPGIVEQTKKEQMVGPLPNVPGLADKSHALKLELTAANPYMAGLLQGGFPVVAVNDGLLAAFAAAEQFGDYRGRRYNSIAYVIVGTGVGAAVVRRQRDGTFRPSEGPFEIGHTPLAHDLDETFETAISGPNLHRKHGVKAEHLPREHQAWEEVGQHLGQMIMKLGMVGGADLVVIGGGVGSYAYLHYYPYLEAYLEKFRDSANAVQRRAVPKVIAVSPEDTQTFEMYGAEGVMRHYMGSGAGFSTSPAKDGSVRLV